jgi:hypothetical protein
MFLFLKQAKAEYVGLSPPGSARLEKSRLTSC